MKKLIFIFALSTMLATPFASALTPEEIRECQTLAASFAPTKKAIEGKVAERDVLAADTEAAGEAWQNAQNVRYLTPERAAEADALRLVWDQKKEAFNTFESELWEMSNNLKKDSRRFNLLCATD